MGGVRYALKREVAALRSRFFRRVCPGLEPGDKYLRAKGYVCGSAANQFTTGSGKEPKLAGVLFGKTAKRFTGFSHGKG